MMNLLVKDHLLYGTKKFADANCAEHPALGLLIKPHYQIYVDVKNIFGNSMANLLRTNETSSQFFLNHLRSEIGILKNMSKIQCSNRAPFSPNTGMICTILVAQRPAMRRESAGNFATI